MIVKDIDHVTGDAMGRESMEAFLTEQGTGILSLTDGEEAYGVPISFGYDGEDRLYFVFVPVAAGSKKQRFAEQTVRATLTVYDIASKNVWTSVVVSGPLRRVGADDWDALLAAVEDNAWYSSAFSEAAPVEDISGWALEIDSLTGRQRTG